MKIAVRYQSRGGNTKAAAEIIAKAAGVKAEAISVPISEPVDLLFVGGGIYKWGIDRSLGEFIENLNPKLVKSIAAFTTAGGMDKTGVIISAARSKDIKVFEESVPLKLGIRNHALLGGKGMITLSDKEIDRINCFVKNAVNSIKNK